MQDMKYFDILNHAEKNALKMGAQEVMGKITTNRGVEITLRDGELETLKESVQAQLSIYIYHKNRYSSHRTNDLDPLRLEKFIRNAVDMTAYLAEDPARHLPAQELYPESLDRDLQLVDQSVKSISLDEKIEMLKELSAHGRSLNNNIISLSADLWDGVNDLYQQNSNGFRGRKSSTIIGLGASVSLRDEGGKKPEGWKYISTRYKNDLPDPLKIAEEAVRRTESKVGARKIKSARMPMLVKNDTAMRVLYPFLSAIRASNLYKERSFLMDRLQQQVASPALNITDDPFLLRGYGSRLFDGSGIAAKNMTILNNGVLDNYYIDNYYGEKLGMKPNADSSSNWLITPGEKSFNELLKEMDKGILVESFIGGNANETTGDFSYGIIGQVVENGEILHPVAEMNISGNMNDLLMNIRELGSDTYKYSSKMLPSILIDNIDFAGL